MPQSNDDHFSKLCGDRRWIPVSTNESGIYWCTFSTQSALLLTKSVKILDQKQKKANFPKKALDTTNRSVLTY